jgi:hypothetical protein
MFDRDGPVLGVDPGLSQCGYGVVRRQGRGLAAVACGVLRTDPAAPLPERLATLEAAEIACDFEAVPLVPDVPVPEELNDRAADSWEPLLSIADAAGGSWPLRARLAAVALNSEDDAVVSVGMRLLADIHEAFDAESHLTTAELLRRLHDLEDAPWADWYGSPLSGRGLAKLLGPYRVVPLQRRVGGEKSRGYFRSEFEDAFRRYVPATGTSGTSGTPTPIEDDYPRSAWSA